MTKPNGKPDDQPLTGTAKTISIIGTTLLFLMLVASTFGDKSENQRELSNEDKILICKHYIASMFGRSPTIMKIADTSDLGGDFYVEIKYTRSSDNTEWRNVCSIDKENRILWAGMFGREIGRWRFEDEEKIVLKTTENGKTIVKVGKLFTIPI